MTRQSEPITLYAAGEVCVNRENPESISELIAPAFKKADVKFFQLETVIAEGGVPSQEPINLKAHPNTIRALTAASFDVCCFASNHTMDWGLEGLEETVAHLAKSGIQTFGAGRNLAEARKPAIIEKKGTRIAFVGYNANLPNEYWAATDHRPGCVPMRVITHYQLPSLIHPGSAPIIRTFGNPEDVEVMLEDIRNVRDSVDVVAVSIHWGLHYDPRTGPDSGAPSPYLADYQKEVAHKAIDAGADILLGTGPHQMKPVEVYKGKVIFYSLGNFLFDFGKKSGIPVEALAARGGLQWCLEPGWIDNFIFPPRGRMGLVAKGTIAEGKLQSVTALPVMINSRSQARLLTPDDGDYELVCQTVQELCQGADLTTKVTPWGDELIIEP